MKNLTRNIFKIFAVLFIVYGCELNDYFLERQPLDKISDASFWNTENDLMVYNNTFYDLTKNDNTYPFLMGHDDGFDSNSGVKRGGDFGHTVWRLNHTDVAMSGAP